MNPRRDSPGQFVLYWFARLPLVWALLVGFGVSALLADVEWYVRVAAIGLVSVVVLGLGYAARSHLLAQVRSGEPLAEEEQPPPQQRRRQIRRRRDR